MKEPFHTQISVFKDLFKSKDKPYTLKSHEIIDRIKKGNDPLKIKISKIRDPKTTKEDKDEIKKTLIAIMFNGTFKARNDNGLDEHSGLCVLDFDNFPDEATMLENKELIIAKPYIFCCFVSPSGNGLKAVARIPKSDKTEHVRRFKAIEKDFENNKYFDNKNSNVSRVCFESYDPEIYVNYFPEEFKGIEEDKGYSYIERVPVCILRDEQKIIDIIMAWDWGKGFVEGERNSYIFDLAGAFCEYGVDILSTEHYIINHILDGSFSENEALTAIRSAYRKRDFGSKYFEDYINHNKIKLRLLKGDDPKDISKALGTDQKAIEQIQEDIKEADDIFWQVQKTKAGSKISIDPFKYAQFLVKNGFNKFYPEGAEKPTFVEVVENKVTISSVERIKDFILDYLLSIGEIEVWNFCSRSSYLFSEWHLNMIDSIHLEMLDDTPTTSFIPFRNGIAKVTKDNVQIVKYVDVEGYIWKDQIVDRDFKEIDDFKNDFQDFIGKVSDEDPEREKALRATIGYLLHTFKDKTHQKAIIFNDEEINDNPNGGSGKSLMLNALNYIRKVVKIDGKSFDPNKSDFVYQRINLDTQILAFDDVKRNFNFEQLFPLITEGITVNRKNKDEVFIDFSKSAKIVITTNYVISGSGNSHERRRHEIEMHQYFNNRRSPLDVYGRLLFDSWNDEDWNKFDNYMISNIQLFLTKGLVKSKSINAESKRLIQATHIVFYEWITEEPIPINKRIYNSEIMQKFTSENKSFRDIPTRRFLSWISEYANFKGYTLLKDRDMQGRYFELLNDDIKDEEMSDCPF